MLHILFSSHKIVLWCMYLMHKRYFKTNLWKNYDFCYVIWEVEVYIYIFIYLFIYIGTKNSSTSNISNLDCHAVQLTNVWTRRHIPIILTLIYFAFRDQWSIFKGTTNCNFPHRIFREKSLIWFHLSWPWFVRLYAQNIFISVLGHFTISVEVWVCRLLYIYIYIINTWWSNFLIIRNIEFLYVSHMLLKYIRFTMFLWKTTCTYQHISL